MFPGVTLLSWLSQSTEGVPPPPLDGRAVWERRQLLKAMTLALAATRAAEGMTHPTHVASTCTPGISGPRVAALATSARHPCRRGRCRWEGLGVQGFTLMLLNNMLNWRSRHCLSLGFGFPILSVLART